MSSAELQHRSRLQTLTLRPHPSEWLPIKYGQVSEFRTHFGFPDRIHPPTPCVLYRFIGGRADTMMWVIEEAWREPLGAVSDESLQRMGYETVAEFRERWVASRRAYFDATKKVNVFRGRLWTPEDREPMAERLLETLYGPYLP